MSGSEHQFHGGWSLVSWEITYPDGRTSFPFGKSPMGQLLYTADGYMSGTICKPDRALLEPDNLRADNIDKLAAAASYFHYAGQWHLEGDVIVHSVIFSLNPNMVGTKQHRNTHFENDTLTLSADEALGDGGSRHHCLVWRRGSN